MVYLEAEPEPTLRPLLAALLVSIAIHAALLSIVHIQSVAKLSAVVPITIIEELSGQDKPRLVSPSDAPDEIPIRETNLFSERNSRTEHQQIRRGQEDGGAQSKPAVSALAHQQASPPTKSLRLRDPELLEKVSRAPLNSETDDTKASIEELAHSSSLEEYRPFSQAGAAALSLSRRGVSDFLPGISDGDITLLNAKAHRHATFVRRVALQVFGALKRQSWQKIPRGEVNRIRDFVTVEATLDKTGKLLSTKVVSSSGSSSFDRISREAAQEGAWDQNPPAGALMKDGNIHFVFQARTWARGAGSGMAEQRWLLLGTGLL